MKKVTYKGSGVDITQANTFVKAIGAMVSATKSKQVLSRKGSFGALFELDIKKYKNPVLVSSTDGVGTKLLIAQAVGMHDTVGIDLVAMNTNDILCVGAQSLYFLDYIACGKLKPNVLKCVMKGIAKGCKLSGCSLIGGETAEMPGMYSKDEYDLAGFAVGVVDKSKIIDGSKIKEGDCLLGLPSSGLHSNGFSFVRKVFSLAEQKKLAKELLKPTKIYVKEILPLIKKFNIKGIAHVTGGAFYEKVTKIIPAGKCLFIDKASWKVPSIFKMIQDRGNVDEKEMYRTFNMGIGLVLVVDKKEELLIKKHLSKQKIKFYEIGSVIKGKRKIVFER